MSFFLWWMCYAFCYVFMLRFKFCFNWFNKKKKGDLCVVKSINHINKILILCPLFCKCWILNTVRCVWRHTFIKRVSMNKYKKPNCLSTGKKKKKKKTLKCKVHISRLKFQTCSDFHFFPTTPSTRRSAYRVPDQWAHEKRKSKRKRKNRTLFVFCNSESWGTLFVSATTGDSEHNSEGRHTYSHLLVFYSITISRVLKITVECRFIDDSSQTKIDLVLKNIAKKIKFHHFIYVVLNFLLK